MVDKKTINKEFIIVENKEDLISELLIWLQGDLISRTLTINQKEWLRPFFETYKLSATNLFNYLDVTKGGPQFFLERNILRFPQSKNPYASYGTAIHEAIARSYINFIQTNILPSSDYLIQIFNEVLISQRLSKADYKKMLHKGSEALPLFHEKIFQFYPNNMKVEVNFRKQNVVINNVPITGTIDQMIIDKEQKLIKVIDLKTGNSQEKWDKGNQYMKKKLINYKLQLNFYKLLIENSRDFNGYKVIEGSLLFVEPNDKLNNKIIELSTPITKEDTDKTSELIKIVYNKILNFDFPDTSKYESNSDGIKDFIKDILDKKI